VKLLTITFLALGVASLIVCPLDESGAVLASASPAAAHAVSCGSLTGLPGKDASTTGASHLSPTGQIREITWFLPFFFLDRAIDHPPELSV
jgi:hypothetical protein